MSTTTMPYFKLDGGQFLGETMGFTNAQVGLYIRMMAIYWERGCKLPPKELLARSLQVRTKGELAAFGTVLEVFFPDGVHERLNQGLRDAQKFSREQSERATKGHQRRQTQDGKASPSQPVEDGPQDF